jgi:formylglycine-generating enzyme required for sulfatase activity
MKPLGIATCSATVLAIVAFPAWRWWQADAEEQRHVDGNETELRVGMTETPYALYKSGTTLQRAQSVRRNLQGNTWIAAGSYFLTVQSGARTLYYPVPILGYRLGPDRDGAFLVAVRPAPKSDPPLARSDLPAFAFVPSGHFLMGDRANPRETQYVWVPAFFIGVFEVTNGEYREFLADPAGYSADTNWTATGRDWKAQERSAASALLRPADAEYRRFGQPDQPVTSVSWFEAVSYCRWLTKSAGAGRWIYRLPTDAEWEKAARGPDGFDYGLSAGISDAETPLYNWKKNPGVPVTVIGWAETRRSFSANRYGIYHASGNVAEWTASAFRQYSRQQPYADDNRNDPEPVDRRTVRGGSWYSATTAPLYLPYRDAFHPWHNGHDVGFRIAAQLVP